MDMTKYENEVRIRLLKEVLEALNRRQYDLAGQLVGSYCSLRPFGSFPPGLDSGVAIKETA